MSPSFSVLSMIIILISALIGLVSLKVLVLAIKGKQISDHPHCAKCKFNLDGLELNQDNICPECGSSLSPQKSGIQNGLNKKRPMLAIFAMIMLMLSIGGTFHTKISKLQSIQNINIYEYFPERLLLMLQADGDLKALQILHDRLIPGTLSDAGLQSLIDHSMLMLKDDSIPWDQRWGDVLMFSMLMEHLSPEQLRTYIEHSMIASISTRPYLKEDDQRVSFMLGLRGNKYGAAQGVHATLTQDARIVKEWERVSGQRNPWRVEVMFDRVWIEKPVPVMLTGAQVFLSDWAAVNESYFESIGSVRISDLSKSENTLKTTARFTLMNDQDVVHTWEQDLETTTQRKQAVEYAEPYREMEVLEQYASSLRMGYIQYPHNRALGREHEGTRNCYTCSFMHIWGRDLPISGSIWALFDVFIRVDQHEIFFTSIHNQGDRSLDVKRSYYEGNMLDFFDDHKEAWDFAYEQGHVDVIFRPNSELAANDPRVGQFIDVEVIFREVPLMILIAKYTGKKSPAGTTWSWVQEKHKSYGEIKGEMLVE